MEKHIIKNIFRLGAMFIITTLTVSAAYANSLVNPGFETTGSNDATAASWNQFGNCARNNTNSTTVTIRTGLYSMQAGMTATNIPAGSGAYQAVSVTPGQNWRLTGYLLNWLNGKLVGPDWFGVAQLVFLDSGSNVLQVSESPHYGPDANMPVNTWVPFEVDATVPASTASMLVYVMAVGDTQDNGSFFFDDLNLYQPGSSNTASVTTAPAVQVSFPTSSQTNETDYQVQSITSLVFSNVVAVNVLTNSSFETNGSGWTLQAGSAYSTGVVPARTGSNTLREVTATTGLVPVTYQSESIPPNSVWDLQGYAYNSSAAPIHQAGTRALLKIVWLNSAGASLQCVPSSLDTNLIGSIETGSYPGITSQIELSGTSPQNVWTFLESRGTAPANATQIQSFCILVTGASGPTETVYFDDINTFQPVGFFGWSNVGPLWLGNSHTNQVMDLIGTSSNKFYRIITP